MPYDPNLSSLKENLVSLKEREVLSSLGTLLLSEVAPVSILEVLSLGLREVGNLFREGKYYITGLMLAGEILDRSMEILLPRLDMERNGKKRGTVLLGSLEGDVHDLGKNMVALFLRADGFQVDDLGVNVAPRIFLREILQREPDVVGVSILYLPSVEPVRRLVRLVGEAYRDSIPPPVFVGCGFLSDDLALKEDEARVSGERELLGVKHVVHDAWETVKLCRSLVEGEEN
jgi:methanogenic corrinoid protein MtbC1